MNWLIVFIGSGIGGAFRFGAHTLAARMGWTTFPVATLGVNVVGSFLLGIVAGYAMERTGFPPAWRLFLATGLLGGFTTFSGFSLDVVSLWQNGRVPMAAMYVLSSLVLPIAALFVGLALIQAALKS